MSKLMILSEYHLRQKLPAKEDYIINNALSYAMSVQTDEILSQAYEFVEDGNYSDALRLYDLILKEEPDNLSALIDKGATLQNMGKIKQAISSYDKILAISPDNLNALLNKGATLHSNQKYLQAIECYDKALKVDRRCTMALAYKGLSLGEMGKLEDAIIYFKKAISIDKYYDLAHISNDIAHDLLQSIKRKKSKIQ